MTKGKRPAKEEAWVDFKEIKERITLEMVLNRYGLLKNLKKSGKNHVGSCPIHQGSNPRQFSVNLERNIFNCFGNCKSGGNVLDFVAKMEKVSAREAALLLQNWFPQALSNKEDEKGRKKRSRKNPPLNKEKTIINPPLSFKLKSLKTEHPFFKEREIKRKAVMHFGLGFCTKGVMKGRVVIPIHDEKEELVAYCGRAIDRKQEETDGKYRLPANFVKSAVVYNLNRQTKGESRLIVVESFFSIFRLYQYGILNTVALMGSHLSQDQANLIVDFLGPDGQATLMFDTDESGQECTKECLERLCAKVFVKALDISRYGKKPHHLTRQQINEIL
jgi:DNA primase